MTTLRRFTAEDLFTLSNVNLDPLTENYNIPFYLGYLARWPDYFYMAESASGEAMGYVMGKAEGRGKEWHGHVTAVTVGPDYRRLGLAKQLMAILETVSENIYNGYFVDLFVRESNAVAIGMYEQLGYTVYRRVLSYYSGSGPNGENEDAYDMRKALPRDVKKESIIPLKHPVRPEDINFD
ncbi:N-alpha-acetyltransferase 20 [Blastocladiella emersonii ATCC 22665]|nr:N-alpha-acetyltransferase 20 [Blastocladiella emersonii ATCC 22665]